MADQAESSIMLELQKHIKNANIDLPNISTIAQKGDERLVEKFMSETIFMKDGESSTSSSALASQLYIACFWGFRDIVKGIFNIAEERGIELDVDAQNKGTKWTALHAATFQEHGPIIMQLLDKGANPQALDSESRSPKDFASASDKIWGHFAALDLKRTPKPTLIEMGIIKKINKPDVVGELSPRGTFREPGSGIRMAAYSRPQSAYAYNSEPFMAAAATGDVLAGDEEDSGTQQARQPQFAAYK